MKITKVCFIVSVIILGTFAHDHPMIGMISHPGSPSTTDSTSYIQGETAKFVEASGARNVRLLYNQDWATSETELAKLNGIFVQNSFSGEVSTDSSFLKTLDDAYKYTVSVNQAGEKFPLMTTGATALALSSVIAGADLSTFTTSVDAKDFATKLNVVEYKIPNSDVDLTSQIRDAFLKPAYTSDVAYFNLDKAITAETIKSSEVLSSNFEVVATAKDRSGKEFIAILKGKSVPVILSFVLFESVYNFYPETQVPHSSEATRLSVQFSKAFTNFARANQRTYGSIEKEYANNLFNHKMTTVAAAEYQTFYF